MKKVLMFVTMIITIIMFTSESYAQSDSSLRVRVTKTRQGFVFRCSNERQSKEIRCPEATYKNPVCNGVTDSDIKKLANRLCEEALAESSTPQKTEANGTSTVPNLTKEDQEKLKEEAEQRIKIVYETAMQIYRDTIKNGIYEMYPSAMGGLIVEMMRNASGKSFEYVLGSTLAGHLLVVWTEEHMKTTMKCQDRSMRKDYREVSDVLRLADTKFLKILKTIEEKAENKQNAKWMMDYYYNYEVPAIREKYRNEKSIRKCN